MAQIHTPCRSRTNRQHQFVHAAGGGDIGLGARIQDFDDRVAIRVAGKSNHRLGWLVLSDFLHQPQALRVIGLHADQHHIGVHLVTHGRGLLTVV